MTELTAEPLTPPTCGTQALDDINKWSCTLYVNATAIDAYKAAGQWKEFFFIDGLMEIDVIKNDKVTPHYIVAPYKPHNPLIFKENTLVKACIYPQKAVPLQYKNLQKT